MEYIFSTNDFTGEQTLKTISKEHTKLTGFQQTVREYLDCTIIDSFHVICKIKSDDDIKGNCYDWYRIDQHSRMIDKTSQIKNSVEELFQAQTATDSAIQDMDAMSVDHEFRLTLLELGLSEDDI